MIDAPANLTNVSFTLATLIGMASGFGGLAVGWGMHRQALKDLLKRFARHEGESDGRDKAIQLLTVNVTALTEMARESKEQMKRVNDILDRMATFPRGNNASHGTWQSDAGR